MRSLYHHRPMMARFSVTFNIPQRFLSMRFAPLSRRLLNVEGPDAATFLQGLVTNNVVRYVKEAPNYQSLYAGILTSQGRVLYDIMIHRPRDDGSSLWLDCDQTVLPDLKNYLQKYKLRAKVQFDEESVKSFAIAQLWPVEESSTTSIQDPLLALVSNLNKSNIQASLDPRLPQLGVRLILPDNTRPFEQLCKDLKVTLSTENEFRTHRFRLGVLEGAQEYRPGQMLPQESNLDYLNGIDYRKGCYVGQELVIRTHHKGVVRKRIVPARIEIIKNNDTTQETPLDETEDIFLKTSAGERKRPDGKLVTLQGDQGLALVRLETLQDEHPTSFFFKGDLTRTLIAQKPFWMK